MKNYQSNNFEKFAKYALLICVSLAALTPLWVFKELLFPFITSKAFYLRIVVEIGLPFYLYLLLVKPEGRPSLKNPLHISVLAFLLLNFVSALAGIDPLKALWGNFERMGGAFYTLHLTLIYFYIVTLVKLDSKLLKRAVMPNIVIAGLLTVYSIFVKWGMTPFVPDPSLPARSSATFGNPIFFPSYLIPFMFLTLFWGIRSKSWTRWIYFFVVFLELIAVYISGTRGAVVGLILGGLVSVFVWLVFTTKSKARTWGLVSSVAVVVLFAALYLNSDKLPQGTVRRIFQLKDSNTQARLIQWQSAIEGFKERPILGTGPENYYIVSNKHYNPEIYKYDPSWFDKPHNYILEVLVTTGILGFMAYAGILVFAIYAFYLAFKLEMVTLSQGIMLFAGFVVYQIQNLFVFDTVSASLSFFVILAVAGCLYELAKQGLNEAGLSKEDRKARQVALSQKVLPQSFTYVIFGLACMVSLYGIWAGNMSPFYASKNTNFGYAYAQAGRFEEGFGFFEKAINNKFNFDQPETASKFSDFALQVLGNTSLNQGFKENVVNKSIQELEKTVKHNPHNPIFWQKLGSLYLNLAVIKGENAMPKAEEVLQKAISLAPKRIEARTLLMQLYLIQGKAGEAEQLIKHNIELNPSNLDTLWQLSIVYKESGQTEKAIEVSEQLIEKNYEFKSTQAMEWLMAYYAEKNEWQIVVMLLEKSVKLDPNNPKWYVNLAEGYYNLGDKEKAKTLATMLVNSDPNLRPQVEKYLKPIK